MGNTDLKTSEDQVASYKILSFRSHAPEVYKGFVFAKWLNSLRYGNDMFKMTESGPYYDAYSKYIDAILKRKGSRLRVAVLSEDEDVAFGWSVDEGPILHYVFVQKEYRHSGIAKSLVPKEIKTFSHITNIGLSIWVERWPHLKFNPFV